ncbi:hypothetical protein [Nonomuraea sp. C10]|uniref:hypothetical protein n=1 Tax=Nonomuraea sp. C10 TaxID=2600577 RepID=UPI0011CDFD5F|nr:hypothetical protein [Nonomuraea sp. C10]TXK35949.1 hypothetical protein FR742_43090 [Nonomuraea sp. C10]
MISDDVWDRLDHSAGTAGKREVRRMSAAFGALAAVVLLVLGASVSGLAVPRLTHGAPDPHISVLSDDAGRIRYTSMRLPHTVVNDGWFPVTVTGVGLRADGIRLAEVESPAFPVTVGSGEKLSMTLGLEVVDCDRAQATLPELVLRVERWWGSQTTSSREDPLFGESSWEFYLRSPCDR